ncbi:MAG: M23 family metallopeptidase, partial [Clostridia bacterium]|nr:M23 family metallopeptidase [Clostridia bacterium]
ILPLEEGYVISSEYGYRVDPFDGSTKFHSGIDMVGEHHGNIYAVESGQVTYAGVQSGYGNCIEIKHTVNGVTVYSFYAHLSEIDVSVGDYVTQGGIIGLEGGALTDPNHGTSTGHHLHFELRSESGSGHSLNPHDYIEI